MDQTDGGGVLACDGGLHRGGLAQGLQLGGVKSLEEDGEQFCEDGFTDMDEINVVIRATLYFILVAFWVLSLHCCGVSTSHFPEITWTPNNVARQHFPFLLMKF